jgi:hypothetical protein
MVCICHVELLRYAIRSVRSCGFFKPGNTIFVPGMYCNQKKYQILGYGTKCMLYEKERMLKELIIKLKMSYRYIYHILINAGFQINYING